MSTLQSQSAKPRFKITINLSGRNGCYYAHTLDDALSLVRRHIHNPWINEINGGSAWLLWRSVDSVVDWRAGVKKRADAVIEGQMRDQ